MDETSLENQAPPTAGQDAHGQNYVLFDQQENAVTSEFFCHVIKEITSETAVQSEANLAFSYDPSFQKLIINQVVIRRNHQAVDRLDPGRFKIIQQETDLNRQIYNGTLSAVLFLDDVRVGDQIEYSYTLSGRNPVWQGQFAGSFLAQFLVPVHHLRYRLLWPADHELYYQAKGTDVRPTIKNLAGAREYVWDFQNLTAVSDEDQAPSWFPEFPWVQLSSFKDWAAVTAWATNLYVTTDPGTPALKECIAGLQRPDATPEQTIQAALDFVQNDIRYLGIEFGPNSYHPSDPAAVLQRRFGDCKDKAFLLCTLLRGLGYEAAPVLVGTAWRQTLPDLLPAPDDFNHAIVRLIVNGNTYWVDPTATYQRGPVSGRFLPDYAYGLVLRPGESGLTFIPASANGLAETLTFESFQAKAAREPASLTVSTTFKNSDAIWMRAVLAAEGREAVANSYLNDYAQRYPKIVSAAPLVVDDHPAENVLTIIHSYLITNFCVLSDDQEKYSCQFYPLGIESWIKKPANVRRTLPLDVSFPRRRVVHTEINLPQEIMASSLTNLITGPAAVLEIRKQVYQRSVTLDYEYRSLTNFVPVSLIPDHFKSLDEMENAIGYRLTWPNRDNGAAHNFNWPAFLAASVYTIACLAGLFAFYRRQRRLPPPPPASTSSNLDKNLTGLSGWLTLVGLGLAIRLVRNFQSVMTITSSFSLPIWHVVTNPEGARYTPAWALILYLELFSQLTILMLNGFCLVFYLQKRRFFPQWFVTMLAAQVITVIFDLLAVHFLLHRADSPTTVARQLGSLFQMIVGCSIWIPYMFISRRVKATFTR